MPRPAWSATCCEETVSTFYESGNGRVNWRYLPATNEVIWFSERDNWGQLYLYDLQTGKLKHQITSGEGNITQLVRVDEKRRLLFVQAVGREKGRDPYFTHFYKVNMDGGIPRLADPGGRNARGHAGRHGRLLRRQLLRPERAPIAVVRDLNGKLMLNLEKADITRLTATGWRPPTPITVKARDGQTDLYGLMFKPSTLDPNRKYPIINQIYPGPQTGSVGGRTLLAGPRRHAGARRARASSSSRSTGWGRRGARRSSTRPTIGDMGDNTLPDQVTGMKQLAEKYPVHRHRPGRDLGALGRRLRGGGSDVPVPGLLQGRDRRVRQPRQPRLRRRLGGEVDRAAREASRTARATTTARPTRRSPRT